MAEAGRLVTLAKRHGQRSRFQETHSCVLSSNRWARNGRPAIKFPQSLFPRRPFLPRLLKSHTHPAAVFVDELDTRGLKRLANHDEGRPARLI